MASGPQDTPDGYHLIVACVVDDPKAMALLRTARDRALDISAKWRAVYIETPVQDSSEEAGSRQRMLRLLELAVQMGGETSHILAESIEKGIGRIISEEKDRLSLLITGSTDGETRQSKQQVLAWDRAIRTARKQRVTVEVIPLSKHLYRKTFGERFRWVKPVHLFYALVTVGIALLGATELEVNLPPALFRINNQNISLLFMIACAFVAGRFGLLPGLVASVASLLIVNYDFTVPYYSLKFNNMPDVLNMTLFLAAAVLISLFTSQTRGYAEKAAKRELNTQALFTLYRLSAAASSRKQALEELQRKLTLMLQMDVAFFLPPALNPGGVAAAYPVDTELNERDKQALTLCWKEMKTTGLASPYYPQSRWRFESMIAPGGEIGVIGVCPRRKGQIDAWFGRLLTAIADQTATVLEHIELERSMEATRIREEREKLRSMLLSSVSHDLKTPLASIIGALSIYRSQGKRLAVEKQEMLIETALEESERLDSFITNILDMTHLESGKIEFKQDWGDMQSVIQHVIRRLEHRLRQHPVKVNALPKVEVLMDMMMIEQVVQNVLDNACKYTPVGTGIEITCSAQDGKSFLCEIHDHGAGLPPEKLERVFDKYARLHKQDTQVAGTGLGLAICKAMMEAQGGSITAANHPDGGAVFRLHMPKWRQTDMTKYVA